ncbi:MAG TPA: chemotaxis protein CheC [Allocoleopsis sp.]
MLLSEHQQDALKELINIAFGRAASSLSELIGQQVLLFVPEVSLHSISALSSELNQFIPSEIATINQNFKGTIAGNAMLLMNYNSAIALANMLTDNQGSLEEDFSVSAYEILTEIGNILLNACLGIFSNLLQIPLFFTVPVLRLEKLEAMINTLLLEQHQLRYALVLKTSLKVVNSEVSCYLIIVSGVTSLHSLIVAIEKWAELSLNVSF